MKGYLINRFDIVNRESFNRYVAAVGPIIKAHQGEILVGNEKRNVLEGTAQQMTVVIQFPSVEAAMGFDDSPEYQLVKPLRTEATVNHSATVVSGEVMTV